MIVHVCDNCGQVHEEAALLEIKDLVERIDPGSVVPSGECPACGALCYLHEVLSPEQEAIVQAARDSIYGNDDIEIDDVLTPKDLSPGGDPDAGCWVRAWVWVGKDET